MMLATVIGGGAAVVIAAALAWKWELGILRVTLAVAALAVAWGALLAAVLSEPALFAEASAVAGLTLLSAFGILAYRFYRDPEREPPELGEAAVISPADGEVVYVRACEGGRIPSATKHGRDYELVELTRTRLREEDAVVIGIAMSFLDVHVNRAPIAGRIRERRHFAGRFGSLRRPEMVYENERATTVIERGDLEVAVVQIASRLVRQIASYVAVGDRVAAGERIGVIRLGSQVDVVIPARPGLRIAVLEGDRVRAGESVLASLPAASASAVAEASPAAVA